jgi:HAE1 family hydrophobic/amphiphilic exporter-1
VFSRFFIHRPIFAAVVSIVLVLAGGITLLNLPVAQYPEIEPPTVNVSTAYPGASARVVADTVAAPIEQEINGVEGMLYMSSVSASDGSYTLTVTFETGTDLDMAAVLVQNRVSTALASLPEEVKRIGVVTKKKSPSFAVAINLFSSDNQYDDIFLSNFATLHVRDEISRLPGAGDVQVMGAGDYSMRLWLDPQRLKARSLTAGDVAQALQEQNVQVAAGVIGQPPAPEGQAFQYTVNALGRLTEVEQFENIIIKTGEGGGITRIKDVGRVELGAQSYDVVSLLNGRPSALVFIYQLPGANLLNLSERVKAEMEELKAGFPQGLDYVVTYDAAWAVQASVEEMVETLFIAALLVIFTVFVFLQDWRATLIPAVTIPVSLVGTFLVMSLLGFSINTLTLFGLVLAIGIVVDDAIVVVENASRNLDESGLPPRQATEKAMAEVTGPVIATTLVLLAVFVPTAFMGGMVGILYKQFALTIATATLFSSINALTLSPALCGLLLRPSPPRRSLFFRGFNRLLGGATSGYLRVVSLAVRRRLFTLLVFVGIGGAVYWGVAATPTGFVPMEDQGYFMTNLQLPDGASLQRSEKVMARVDKILSQTPGVANFMSIIGFSILEGNAVSNVGANVVVLEPWDQRDQDPAKSLGAILGRVSRRFSQIQEANVVAFPVPPLPGLGVAGGFDLMVEDRAGMGLGVLQQAAQELVQRGNAQKELTNLFTSVRTGVPQLFVDVDRTKVLSMQVPLSSVFNTMQAMLGSAYVNDFNKFGRTYQVRIQADSRFRAQPGDIERLQVRSAAGEMVPLAAVAEVREIFGPQTITRYNMYPAASVKGDNAPGYSSGQALQTMAQTARQTLPQGMGFDWTGQSYQEVTSGGMGGAIFGLAVVFVFLVLAAQYESWKIPIPVILSVPLALSGAFGALLLVGETNNVYTQIGLVLLVGLATKNAILIVEFAKERCEEGMGAAEAAVEASRLRFRPILMTAFSFILGVLPLVFASGAGAAARFALGVAVLGGMLAATVLGVIFVPALFAVFQRLGSRRGREGRPPRPDQGQA